MKHLLFFSAIMFLLPKIAFSQEHNVHPVKYIFNPNANAKEDLDKAIATAGNEHKHVLILVGGDWSTWSKEFNDTLKINYLQEFIAKNFVFLRINFSPSNRNA